MPDRSQSLDLVQEQRKDDIISEVISGLARGSPDQSPNLPITLRKYKKHFNRLILEHDILYRLSFDDCSKIQHKQFCVPKHLLCEVVFRLHNSKMAGIFGIGKTVAEFRKRFYFPNFTDFSLTSVKHCLTCLQLKRAPSKNLNPPLQRLWSLTSYPGETLQIDIVGHFQSPHYLYVLTAIDVFTKYLFAAPLTNVRANTIARELTAIFFRHSYIPCTIPSVFQT